CAGGGSAGSCGGSRSWAGRRRPGSRRRATATRASASSPARSGARSSLVAVTVYADLFRYRELFGNLFRRDLQTRYKGSVLGVAWSLVNPLVLMGIYVLVFSLLWKVAQVRHYALYLLVGLAVWLF